MKKQTKQSQAIEISDAASAEVGRKTEMPVLSDETARVIPPPAFPIVGVGASALVNAAGQVYAIATTERKRKLETGEPGSQAGVKR
jgi:hypothetical protein